MTTMRRGGEEPAAETAAGDHHDRPFVQSHHAFPTFSDRHTTNNGAFRRLHHYNINPIILVLFY